MHSSARSKLHNSLCLACSQMFFPVRQGSTQLTGTVHRAKALDFPVPVLLSTLQLLRSETNISRFFDQLTRFRCQLRILDCLSLVKGFSDDFLSFSQNSSFSFTR